MRCSKVFKNTFLFICLFVFAACSSSTNTQSQVDANKKFSSDQLKEDFGFLYKTYEQAHPSLYANASKKNIDSIYSSIQSKLNRPMDAFEFYKEAIPLVAKIGDGHTNLNSPYEFRQKYLDNGGRIIPFDVRIDGDRLFSQQNYTADTTLVSNSEILSINGIKTKEILNSLRKYRPGEKIEFVNGLLAYFFKPLIWTEYGFGDEFKLEFISSKTKDHLITTLNGITKLKLDSLLQKMGRNPSTYHKWLYIVLDDGKSALLKMNSFGNTDDIDRFKNYIDSVFTKVKEAGVQNLIVDVRGNGGGENEIGEELIKYLAVKPWILCSKGQIKASDILRKEFIPWYVRWIPLKTLVSWFGGSFSSLKIDRVESKDDSTGTQVLTIYPEKTEPIKNDNLYTGKTYVLIDHSSYSMSVMFAAVMKDHNFATLIGEETGQEASPFGMVGTFKLPNSNLMANVPMGRSFRPSGVVDTKGVLPDYEVKQNPADTEKQIDTAIEFTRELIKKNNVAKSDNKK